MTTLYRRTPDEPPFGKGTLWTMWTGSADLLAQIEAGTPTIGDLPLHQREMLLGDHLAEVSLDEVVARLQGTPVGEALPRMRDALLREGERLAAAGAEWVQFTERGQSWNGAMLYVGDGPMAFEVLPPV